LHRENLPGIFQPSPGPARERDYFLGVMDDPQMCLLVAETVPEAGSGLEPVMAGSVHVMLRDTPPIPLFVPRRLAMIDNLVVKGALRRLGIGQALMEAAQRWAASAGADTVELTVFEFNTAAKSFYEYLGYETENRRMVLRL
jgi:ribosomal protein S18 acetylase RimI-like enzyme